MLLDVQYGETPADATLLKHVAPERVWELAEDYNRSTYRAAYTVAFWPAVYVLHVFQKKSKRGVQTPMRDIQRILSRLELARRHARTLSLQPGVDNAGTH